MQASLRSWPLLTLALVLANLGVFAAQYLQGVHPVEPELVDVIRWGGNLAPLTLTGENWRLFSSMFLQIGVMHLLFNMLMLISWGPVVERHFGRVIFLQIYLLAGLAGSLLSVWWYATHRVAEKVTLLGQIIPAHLQLVVSAGASGALMGIAAALTVAHWLGEHNDSVAEVDGLNTRSMATMVAVNIGFGFMTTGVDNACHIGGALAGALLGALFAFSLRSARPIRYGVPAGVLLAAVGLGAFVYPIQSSDPELLALRDQIRTEQRELEAQQQAEADKVRRAARLEEERASAPAPVAPELAAGRVLTLGSVTDLALSPDGKLLYATDNERNSLSEISMASYSLSRTLAGPALPAKGGGCTHNTCRGIGAAAVTLSPDGRFAYVASMQDDALSILDLASGKIEASVGVGRYPSLVRVSRDGSRIYVFNLLDNSVSLIDARTRKAQGKPVVLQGGSAEGLPFGRPIAMELSADEKQLYVINGVAGTIDKLDSLSLSTLARYPDRDAGGDFEGFHALQVTADGELWAMSDQQMTQIDANTMQARDVRPFCDSGSRYAFAISPDKRYLALAEQQYNRVVLLSLDTGAALGVLPTGPWPLGLVFRSPTMLLSMNAGENGGVSWLDTEKRLSPQTLLESSGEPLCPREAAPRAG